MLFDRVWSVSIIDSNDNATEFQNIRMTFRVLKTESSEANRSEISLYNLSGSTRAQLEQVGSRVLVQAGYRLTGLKVLAVGDVLRVSSQLYPPNRVTTVVLGDGAKALRDTSVSVSFGAGTPAKTMFQELSKLLQVDGVDLNLDLEDSFKHGWSYVGDIRGAIDGLAKRFGFTWSIQNNTLQATAYREPTRREAVLLSPSSGLIGSPYPKDDTGQDLTDSRETGRMVVTSLMNPALVPGDPVAIEAEGLPRASYRVTQVEHSGDTHATNWTSRLEVVGINGA